MNEKEREHSAATTSSPVVQNFDYYPQLDGLRALAVFLVMAWHFLPYDNSFRDSYRWGWFGVRLFFVLSGFLISGILLREKKSNASISGILYAFYARRALRIFPLYYAYIALLLLTTKAMFHYLPWFVLYLHNILMFKEESLSIVPGSSMLWTLAIEEQFYLVWPLALLIAPIKRLPIIMACCIFTGIATRCILRLHFDYSTGVAMVFPLSNIDSLVMGSLLAYWRLYASDQNSLSRWLNVIGLAGFAFMATQFAFWNYGGIHLEDTVAGNLSFITSDFFASLFFIFAIDRAARCDTGFVGPILSHPWASAIGRVSYGIYVLHMLCGNVVWLIAAKIGFANPERHLALFVPCIALSIFVSLLSWKLFENPINKLKRFFPYPRQ